MLPELWWHEGTPSVSIRLHPYKQVHMPEYREQVPWCPTGRYLMERLQFTLDPHFHAGAYYVQEASSMFLAQLGSLFKEHEIKRVLDLCAAPGGKSTLLAELLPEEGILVANEVIRSRMPALTENMAKWGYPNVVVTQNDAVDFSLRSKGLFDAVLVDAPCSGEGMFRKEPDAVRMWSAETVQLCAERQRRIVADVWEALRPGGYLMYSTCTFNRSENEENVNWICAHLGADKCAIQIDPAWGIVAEEECYRFFPNRLKGEGFFFALLQKKRECKTKAVRSIRTKLHKPIARQQMSLTWIREGYHLFAKGDLIKALPTSLAPEMVELEACLRVVQSGVAVARNKGNDTVPEADLALSLIMHSDAFPVVEVDLHTARRYLAREALVLKDAPLGYLLIQYQGSRLGFAKNIGSRINNLYPLARRIRMEI